MNNFMILNFMMMNNNEHIMANDFICNKNGNDINLHDECGKDINYNKKIKLLKYNSFV